MCGVPSAVQPIVQQSSDVTCTFLQSSLHMGNTVMFTIVKLEFMYFNLTGQVPVWSVATICGMGLLLLWTGTCLAAKMMR